MRTLANILWHIPFLGFLNALTAFLLGTFLVFTVIGIPIGLGLIQYSRFLLTPFTGNLIDKRDLGKKQNRLWLTYGRIIQIIYIPLGIILSIITILQITLLFFTIVGIPLAIILAKSLGTYFNPVNKIYVPKMVAAEAARRKGEQQIDRYFNK
jgi:uncharacterized membrane protein YccF (DUF307 family)